MKNLLALKRLTQHLEANKQERKDPEVVINIPGNRLTQQKQQKK